MMLVTILTLLTAFQLISCEIDLSSRVSEYELVSMGERRLGKRDTATHHSHELHFNAFGDQYRVLLRDPPPGLLDARMKVVAVDSSGREEEVRGAVRHDELFAGRVKGDIGSSASLARLPDGGYVGVVRTRRHTLYLEPANLHSSAHNSSSLLVYREKDVRSPLEGRRRDTAMHTPMSVSRAPSNPLLRYKREPRERRADTTPAETVKKNRCAVKVVADTRFFKDVGKGDVALTARYIVNLIDRVNVIFSGVEWGEDGEGRRLAGMGLSIKKITILRERHRDFSHYNSARKTWREPDLLDAFTHHERDDAPDYCLVHLVTAQSFESFDGSSAIGLSWVADSKSGYGGICSNTNSVGRRFNTLMTSAFGSNGQSDYLLVTREMDIVAAHEYGHSWGASHDNEGEGGEGGEECSPRFNRGGKYIMYSFTVSGYDENNNKFSPCSVRAVRRVLAARAEMCLEEEAVAYCGNGVVEPGEQCDDGDYVSTRAGTRSCCTSSCLFSRGALCSPRNEPCCSPLCAFLPTNHTCADGDFGACQQASNCTGHSGACPSPAPTADGSICVDAGECRSGVCMPYCRRAQIGKLPCICQNVSESCRRCCKASESAPCVPEEGAGDLADGTWCVVGSCRQSVCVREVADASRNIWAYLDNIDRNTFWPFVKSNLVAIVVVVSLLVWCPASMCVNYMDQQAARQAEARRPKLREVHCDQHPEVVDAYADGWEEWEESGGGGYERGYDGPARGNGDEDGYY